MLSGQSPESACAVAEPPSQPNWLVLPSVVGDHEVGAKRDQGDKHQPPDQPSPCTMRQATLMWSSARGPV